MNDEIIIGIKSFLSTEECQELIEISEKMGFQKATVGNADGVRSTNEARRNNSRLEYINPALAKMFSLKLASLLPATHDGRVFSGLSPKFKFYRYSPGEKFDWHQDGSIVRGLDEKSYFTLVIYLNGNCLGGETEFQSGAKFQPLAGDALCFEHQLIHRGAEVIQGSKYVLRTDVLYTKNRNY